MSRHIGFILVVLILIGLGLVIFAASAPAPAAPAMAHTATSTPVAMPTVAGSYLDATYVLDGTPVTLEDGSSSMPAAEDASSTIDTSEFGSEVGGDLNGDGAADIAFLLTQSGEGSGTFYYAVAALATSTGYIPMSGVFLGDRIKPVSIQIKGGEFIVNYLDHASTSPMSAKPSVPVTAYLEVANGQLVEASSTQ